MVLQKIEHIYNGTYAKNRLNIRPLKFIYDYQTCMYIDSSTGYIGPPNCVHYRVSSSY